jgi:hypothetical protein
MASFDEVRDALLAEILKKIEGSSTRDLVRLSEAYAWVRYPNQSHAGGGGEASQSK